MDPLSKKKLAQSRPMSKLDLNGGYVVPKEGSKLRMMNNRTNAAAAAVIDTNTNSVSGTNNQMSLNE